jgi:hypothetical protein
LRKVCYPRFALVQYGSTSLSHAEVNETSPAPPKRKRNDSQPEESTAPRDFLSRTTGKHEFKSGTSHHPVPASMSMHMRKRGAVLPHILLNQILLGLFHYQLSHQQPRRQQAPCHHLNAREVNPRWRRNVPQLNNSSLITQHSRITHEKKRRNSSRGFVATWAGSILERARLRKLVQEVWIPTQPLQPYHEGTNEAISRWKRAPRVQSLKLQPQNDC